MSQPESDRPEGKDRQANYGLLDCDVMGALSKQIRVEILAVLVERPASPKELVEEVGESLSVVSYHTERLLNADLIFLKNKVARRGAVEHFYRAKWPTIVPPHIWDDLPDGMQSAVGVQIIQQFLSEIGRAFEDRTVTRDSGELCLTPLLLDEAGETELAELNERYLDGLLAVQQNATHRMGGTDKKSDQRARNLRVMLSSFVAGEDSNEERKAGSRLRL